MQKNNGYEPIKETKQILKGDKKGKHTGRNILIIFVVVVLIALPFMLHIYSNGKVDSKLREITSVPRGDCLLNYDKSKYSIWSKHLEIRNLTVTCSNQLIARFGAIDIAKFEASPFLLSDFNAQFYDTTVNIGASKFGQYALAANEIGYSSLVMTGSIDFSYNAVGSEFTLKKLTADIASLGIITAELTINNIVATSTTDAFTQIVSTPFDNLWMKFSDNGFTDKVVSAYAKSSLVDIIKAKQRILAAVDRNIQRMPADKQAEKNQLVGVYRFLERPNEILLTSNRNVKASLSDLLNSVTATNYRELVKNVTTLPVIVRNN